jgi:hypothetical protein
MFITEFLQEEATRIQGEYPLLVAHANNPKKK